MQEGIIQLSVTSGDREARPHTYLRVEPGKVNPQVERQSRHYFRLSSKCPHPKTPEYGTGW